MPCHDYRCIYSENTRLSELAGDKEVLDLLKKDLPQAYGAIEKKDKEMGNLTLGTLPTLFYMGFKPEVVNAVNDKIFALKRW